MNKKVLATMLALATMLSLFTFAACSPSGSGSTTTAGGGTQAGDAAPAKDSITVAYNAEPTSLLSWEANDLTTQSINSNIYDTLIRRESDGTLVPGLATEWTFSDDGTEITFTLRDGVKFHNGDTMTADDVVFSINSAIGSKFTARMTGSFDRMEKVDDTHVKLILKYPYGPVEGCVSSVNCGIVSQSAFEANQEGFSRSPVATGPYKFTEWKPGESISFEANGDYFRTPAAIKKLTFRIVSDAAAALVALETGQIDLMNNPATSDFEHIKGNAKLQFSSVPASSFFFVAFNNTDGVFAENKVLREAVSYAINPNAILLGALDGNGALVTAPMPVGIKFYPDGFEGFTFDTAKAKQILTDNGFLGLKIKVPSMDSGNEVKIAEVVVEQLRQAGFDAELQRMERTAFLADVYTNCDYDICVNSYTAFYPDADFITYMRYHSSYLGGGNNFVMVNNPDLDALLDTARFSNHDAVRAQAYRDFSQKMKEEVVLVPILAYLNALGANSGLKGVQASNTQRIYVYDMSW